MENLLLLFLVLAAIVRAWSNTQAKKRGFEERKTRIPDFTPEMAEELPRRKPASQEARSKKQEAGDEKREVGDRRQEQWGRLDRPQAQRKTQEKGMEPSPRRAVPMVSEPRMKQEEGPAPGLSGLEDSVTVSGNASRRERFFPEDGRGLAKAVIFAEVLGPPRAAAPWRPQNWMKSRS